MKEKNPKDPVNPVYSKSSKEHIAHKASYGRRVQN
jgi:hypothetical protein